MTAEDGPIKVNYIGYEEAIEAINKQTEEGNDSQCGIRNDSSGSNGYALAFLANFSCHFFTS